MFLQDVEPTNTDGAEDTDKVISGDDMAVHTDDAVAPVVPPVDGEEEMHEEEPAA